MQDSRVLFLEGGGVEATELALINDITKCACE